MKTSIIIPTYNHREYVGDAIRSALAQTAHVEVIVVDDGSTDGTAGMVAASFPVVRLIEQKHAGPSAARNRGLDAARGDFVMFLDADDVIAPNKVARQVQAMTPDVGFVLCDVKLEGNGPTQLASERYDYASKNIGGWIGGPGKALAAANFIPNMSPLFRRSVLTGIRFHPTREPEDWHFICEVAEAARCRYIPEVLATYRKRADGRNNSRKRSPWLRPGVVPPTRLNLGCGTPNSPSWHPIAGMVNLDKSLGWRYEDGLIDFVDGSVAGITISHSLMYVALEDWPRVFAEFARVLRPGGVIRITEDDTEHPDSVLYGKLWNGSEPGRTLTGPKMARGFLEQAGFTVHDVTAKTTKYKDRSLIQAQHRPVPDVFFIEGIREVALLFEPHADDGALFSAYNAIRYQPRVITCFPSSGDYGDTDVRAAETREAMAILGAGPCEQWDGTELEENMRALDKRIAPTIVFAPSPVSSHSDHVAVAQAARAVFGDRVRAYHTYVDEGARVTEGTPVAHPPEWEKQKALALTCYQSQIWHPRARKFFDWYPDEYVE